jgi:hypothetical protein
MSACCVIRISDCTEMFRLLSERLKYTAIIPSIKRHRYSNGLEGVGETGCEGLQFGLVYPTVMLTLLENVT